MMLRSVVCVLSIFLFLSINAQYTLINDAVKNPNEFIIYDTDFPAAAFFAERRQALRDSLPANSVAVIFSGQLKTRSLDMDFDFHQNPNLFYLTGLNEPDAMLLIFKNEEASDTLKTNEILFVQPKNPTAELWSGKRMGVKNALKNLCIKTVLPNTAFSDFMISFDQFSKITYIPTGSDIKDNPRDRGDLFSLYQHFKEKTEGLQTLDSQLLLEILAGMRQIKKQDELNLMIKAINITCNAHKELMKTVEPGMFEYQAQAIIEYMFKNRGAENPAFPSICGSGENSCVLHYSSNRRKLQKRDLMVVDVGAEYHGYCADVTRTIPVDGTFTDQQKAIYKLVLKAQKSALLKCVEGRKFWEPNETAQDVIANGLLELGIIKNRNDYHKYFPHGTSHYLGLDVHDVGLFNYLQKGNVITVEPGIYIPSGSDCDPKWWNIGIRIEDDVLITSGEPEVLSAGAPKEIEEIESLMQKTGTSIPDR